MKEGEWKILSFNPLIWGMDQRRKIQCLSFEAQIHQSFTPLSYKILFYCCNNDEIFFII